MIEISLEMQGVMGLPVGSAVKCALAALDTMVSDCVRAPCIAVRLSEQSGRKTKCLVAVVVVVVVDCFPALSCLSLNLTAYFNRVIAFPG